MALVTKADLLEKSAVDLIMSNVEEPRALKAALATNPHLREQLGPMILEAVRLSFSDPETSMHVLTAGELKRRAQICLDAITIMYCEQNLTLHQCYACIGIVLLSTLKQAKRAEDIGAAQRQGMYASAAQAAATAQAKIDAEAGVIDAAAAAGTTVAIDKDSDDLADGLPVPDAATNDNEN